MSHLRAAATPRWLPRRESNASDWLFGEAEPGGALAATTRTSAGQSHRSATVLAVTIGLSVLAHSAVLLLVLIVLPHRTEFPAPSVEPSVALVFESPPPAANPDIEPPRDTPTAQVQPSAEPAVTPPAPPDAARMALPEPPAPPVDAPQPKRTVLARPAAPVRPLARPVPPAPAGPQTNLAERPRSAGTDVLIPPRPVAGMETNRPPAYPQSAQRRGVEGSVMLRVGVSADGTPLEVDVLQTSGSPALDQAAISAVRQWRFVPATQAGNPVAAIAEVPIRFQLER